MAVSIAEDYGPCRLTERKLRRRHNSFPCLACPGYFPSENVFSAMRCTSRSVGVKSVTIHSIEVAIRPPPSGSYFAGNPLARGASRCHHCLNDSLRMPCWPNASLGRKSRILVQRGQFFSRRKYFSVSHVRFCLASAP